jgi:DNA-binding NtrC family response regulator
MSETTQDRPTVLIVDDEPLKRISLQIELSEAGYQVLDAPDGRSALRILDTRPIDIVVTDQRMPVMDGLSLLDHVKQKQPGAHVIVMTAYGTVTDAVEAMKRGAYDYILKPFKTETLLGKLERIVVQRGGLNGGRTPQALQLGRLLGRSQAMQRLFDQIRTVADSERTILIHGESGTGKELVAEAIVALSRRKDKPFTRFSCAALQPTVLESELFGHEMGAFTGAIRQKLGRFELSNGGTVFLDEVDDIPPEIQVKLLRVLEQQEFERVGGEEPIKVDVRLICATKNDLGELVEAGKFRTDLYYRLNVICLYIVPLRDRADDIPILVRHFLEKHGSIDGGPSPTISPHALDLLMSYHWPGNVRELEHVVECALTYCQNGAIGPEHIPVLGSRDEKDAQPVPSVAIAQGLTATVSDVEKQMIHAALRQAEGNQAKAAQLLNIPRTTLRDKIAKYGLTSES